MGNVFQALGSEGLYPAYLDSVSREAKGTEFRGLRGQDLAADIQRLNFSCRRCQARKEKSMCGRLEVRTMAQRRISFVKNFF